MTIQTHKHFAGFQYNQELFGKEVRFSYSQKPGEELDASNAEAIQQALGLNETKNDAEIKGPSYTVDKAQSQVEQDINAAIANLKKQSLNIIPRHIFNSDKDYTDGIQGIDQGNILSKTIGDFYTGTRLAISKKGEIAQQKLQEVSYKETVILGATEKLRSERDTKLEQKKQILKLQELANGQRSFLAKANPFTWKQQLGQTIDAYRFEKSEVKGVEDSLNRLQKEETKTSREKTELERGIQKDFAKQMESKKAIVRLFEDMGVKEEGSHILELFAAEKIILQGGKLVLKSNQEINDQSKVEDALNTINTNVGEMGEKSQNFFRDGLNTFLEQKGKDYLAFEQAQRLETESRNRQAKETQVKANWEKLYNTKLGTTVSLPKIHIGGKKLEAKEYIATERKGKEVTLMLKGADALKQNFIRFNSTDGTYKFESNPQINDTVKKAAKVEAETLQSKLIENISSLYEELTSPLSKMTESTKRLQLKAINKSLTQFRTYRKTFSVNLSVSKKYKEAMEQLKDIKTS